MSAATQFDAVPGRLARVTRYESGAGIHAFLPSARWARVTVTGGGGKGGNSGMWQDGSFVYHYEAGSGGGAAETRVFEFDPSTIGSAAYAVGAAGSPSVFHSVTAAPGANGGNGTYSAGGAYTGGLGGGLQRLGPGDMLDDYPTAPINSHSLPGESGGHGHSSDGGNGGNSALGKGGTGGAFVTASVPTPCNDGSPGTGYGAGGGGAGAASGPSSGHPLGAGALGQPGLIVVEEWVL